MVRKPEPVLRPARREHLPVLVRYIQANYRQQGIPFNLYRVERALLPLLERADCGRVWIVARGEESVGYIILCFGFAMQSAGRVALLDEFHIEGGDESLACHALELALEEAASLGIRSVFLEVRRGDERAQQLYGLVGFQAREERLLMKRTLAD